MNFLALRGMAQPGEESFDGALQPGERGHAGLRLDQVHQETTRAYGLIKCLQGRSDGQRTPNPEMRIRLSTPMARYDVDHAAVR